MTMSARLARSVVFLSATVVAGSALAAEICITCAGPDAVYRCASDSFEGASATDARLQLLCITQLAKSGRHASCAADRRNLHACEGELRVLAPDVPGAAPMEAAAPPDSAPQAPPPAKSDVAAVPENATTTIEKTTPAPPDGPPATVEEMARETAQKSGENLDKAGKAVTDTAKAAGDQIGKAGDAVGTAAKKTWDCVTSLFKEC